MTKLMEEGKISRKSRVCFVNDGSRDQTWSIIERLHEEDPLFSGINLSRNRGHQNALLAGLMTVRQYADMAISMDADLHADYRLMSKRALDGLAEFGEVNLFLRGMVPLVGYPSDVVYYERAERFAGESKYPLKKMVSFAMDGITSLSIEPIRMITTLGVVVFLFSLAILVYSLIRHAMGATVAGWTFLNISVWAIGGLILLSLGVIGEYIGKIYMETKHRPRFLVERFLDEEHGFSTKPEKKPREQISES